MDKVMGPTTLEFQEGCISNMENLYIEVPGSGGTASGAGD